MNNLDAAPVWEAVSQQAVVKSYRGKRAFDVTAALLMCAAFAPVAACAALLVLQQSGSPVLFRHRRVGQGGKPFNVYKFRSMVSDAESRLTELLASDPAAAAEWQQAQKLKNDPRITAIGKLLRKTSLDELPQLINVLKGEMSLVGPRPVVDAELARYGASLPFYLAVKPGLTGLWQVSGRSDVSYEQRVAMDVQYAQSQSLMGDVFIALKTARVLLRDRSAY